MASITTEAQARILLSSQVARNFFAFRHPQAHPQASRIEVSGIAQGGNQTARTPFGLSAPGGNEVETTSSPAVFELPPFYCPIEPAIHPRSRILEECALEWISRSGICPDIVSQKAALASSSAEAVCRIAPHAEDDERMLLFILWCYWGFLHDDLRHDGAIDSGDILNNATQLVRCLEAPPGALPTGDPYQAFLADLVQRMYDTKVTPTQIRRFAQAIRTWLMGTAQAQRNIERGITLPLSEWLMQRLVSGGGGETWALMEIANGPEIPGRVMDSPAARAITDMTSLIADLDNDFYSYHKEQAQAEEQAKQGIDLSSQQLFPVIMRERHCSFQEAVFYARAIRDRLMTLWLRVRNQLLLTAEPDFARHLQGLGHGIRANIDWSATAPRYQNPAQPAPLRFTDNPSDSSTQAPPIPSIAWWWDLP